MLDKIDNRFSGFFLIIVVFYIWHTTIPALGFYTPAAIFAGCVLFLYIYIFYKIQYLNELYKVICFIIPILGLNILSSFIGTSSWVIKLYGLLQIGLYPLLMIYISVYCNEKFIRYLFWAIVGSYIFTAITTYIGCIMYPGAARTLAVPEGDIGIDIYSMYKIANIGNLTFTYSLVLLLPPIIYLIKSKIVGILIPIVMLCILTITIIETEYTTALLLMLISYSLFLLPLHIERRHILLLVIAIIFVFLLGKYVIGGILIEMSTIISSDTISVRLYDLGTILTHGIDNAEDGDVGTRMDLYNISINSFLQHPLWGGNIAGGHSLFFDSLALFGLLGLLAFCLSYKKVWKYFYYPLIGTPYFGYLMFSFVLVIIMAVLNPKDNLGVLTFTIPLFALYYKQKYESTLDR